MSRGRRLHPMTVVGDMFGCYTVVEVLPRGLVIEHGVVVRTYGGRHDERIRYRCTCGRESITYTYNLRAQFLDRCPHERPPRAFTRQNRAPRRSGAAP